MVNIYPNTTGEQCKLQLEWQSRINFNKRYPAEAKTFQSVELDLWLASRPEVGALNDGKGGLKFYTNFPYKEVDPFQWQYQDAEGLERLYATVQNEGDF